MTWRELAYRVVWTGFGIFTASWVLLGIWDLYLIAKGKLPGNSASSVILEIASEHPALVFGLGLVLGALIGHLLWAQVLRVQGGA